MRSWTVNMENAIICILLILRILQSCLTRETGLHDLQNSQDDHGPNLPLYSVEKRKPKIMCLKLLGSAVSVVIQLS